MRNVIRISVSELRNIIKECLNESLLYEHELDFKKGGALYTYQHGTSPHRELPNFKPKLKPLIMYYIQLPKIMNKNENILNFFQKFVIFM